MFYKIATFIHNRPITISLVILGLAICGVIFISQEERIDKVENRIVKVESNTPCFKLTARESALKLYASLPNNIRNRSVRIIREELKTLLAAEGKNPNVVPK